LKGTEKKEEETSGGRPRETRGGRGEDSRAQDLAALERPFLLEKTWNQEVGLPLPKGGGPPYS